ncbi:hypothetical protein LCGC14_0364630 [marine sediment metagenome]|uniref:Uncharacterized protein n=1 Tax=marine sediment metagenome TaxID=412755 RepID=A0A0F9VU37_9ZZZZ
MKYIILLISLSFAQVIAPIGMGEKMAEKEIPLWYINDNGITSRVITKNDFFKYAEECYNDTSMIDSGLYSEHPDL